MKLKVIDAGILLLSLAVFPFVDKFLKIGAAYKAKLLCSQVFFAGRTPQSVLDNDLNGPERFFPTFIDWRQQQVTSGWPWLLERTAQYIPSVGCALLINTNATQFKQYLQTWTTQLHPPPNAVSHIKFRRPESTAEKITALNLNKSINTAFSATGESRALLVFHQNHLLYERYATGFHADQPILGWSMTKSVLNAIIGILIRQGRLQLHQAAPVQQWQTENDPRRSITIDQLLHMSSGLAFNEVNGAIFSDVTDMLFMQPDCGVFAANKPLSYTPGSHWQYSSGTSNILSGVVTEQFGGSELQVINFIRHQLFYPLGMYQASIEPDSSGHLITSSFMYATAREWLRFGQLYLNDGIWEGQYILPEGWVQYSHQKAPASDSGDYGAHFWINCGTTCPVQDRPFPKLPGDLFYASGYKGQRLVIIPSQQLIILRLGWDDLFNDAAMAELVQSVLNAINK